MRRRANGNLGWLAAATAVACLLAFPALAPAHVERPAYWPDPAPDCSIHPCAGGKVPHARPLSSALRESAPGRTLVVCKRNSLMRARRAISAVERKGYALRPTQKRVRMSARQGHRLLRLNRRLFELCRYRSIQKAVFAARNHDFIVVMPGLYTERRSRRQPTDDPACRKYLTDTDFGEGAVGLSYRYQWHCPNDQALINVLGRRPAKGAPPPPQPDRHGIPDLGPCVRCDLQIEGSGPRPEDTVVDSGDPKAGFGGPSGVGSAKDVGLKVDRADGFVLRNMTFRHAAEHAVYILETDGYLMDRDKYFYAGEYGALMFASDHGLTKNCESVGNGDSAVYPGGAPDTGEQTIEGPERLNQEIRRCDLHHNNLGYSGTMGNATHVDHNNIYDNTTGIATDSFFAGGHPGFPQDSAVFDHNRIYSNNFDDYAPDSDVKSRVGVPLGTGIIIAGGNADIVAHNRIYDNWRRGAMLLAVPDVLSCPPGTQTCTSQNAASTSFDNHFYGNVLGRAPGGKVELNGVDFWWDQFPSNTGNCWHDNIGPDGTNASWTGDPERFAQPGLSVPGFLPELCRAQTNVGTGNPVKEAVLAYCAEAAIGDPTCEWYTNPGKPGSSAAAAYQRRTERLAKRILATAQLAAPQCSLLGGLGGTISCAGYGGRP